MVNFARKGPPNFGEWKAVQEQLLETGGNVFF